MSKGYKIIAAENEIVYKDNDKRLVFFLIDPGNEAQAEVYHFYRRYIHAQLLDFLLNLDCSSNNRIYDTLREHIKEEIGSGPASDICDTLLSSLYLADLNTGKIIFNKNIDSPDDYIKWDAIDTPKTPTSSSNDHRNRTWIYICGASVVLGILFGILIAFIPGWLNNPNEMNESMYRAKVQDKTPLYKINAVYDPKSCTIYFTDTKFETIEYYIDYQKKVKNIDDINWQLQSSTLSNKDTLYLKDNCTVYMRGENDATTSEVQVIDVSYYDFITELLVTHDPLISSMLVTNSSSPFGNTTFMVDGVPQQVSYYKSAELTDYIKKGFKVTGLKTIGSNLNPTNRHYPKLAKITIQKQ